MICLQMAKKSATDQLNLRVPTPLLERLSKASERYEDRPRTEIAIEVINRYLDFWEEAERMQGNFRQRQMEILRRELLTQDQGETGTPGEKNPYERPFLKEKVMATKTPTKHSKKQRA